MSRYISSFIIPVPKKNLKIYKAMAKKSAQLWMKHGALEYVEALGDGLTKGKTTSFPRSVKLKAGETVAVGFAVFKSSAHFEKVMDKLHNDPAMMKIWDEMPFDGMRMIWGTFDTVVSK